MHIYHDYDDDDNDNGDDDGGDGDDDGDDDKNNDLHHNFSQDRVVATAGPQTIVIPCRVKLTPLLIYIPINT